MLGTEVDKSSKTLLKTLNAMEHIKSKIQNIEGPRIDNHIM